jgi:2-polyprenyl-3-methyl-5-hydroxy-6-metoxy-1,4-benzoquinol methylase
MEPDQQQQPGQRHSGWKNRWEQIYAERDPTRVSWYQAHPEYSLNLIGETGARSEASIIDVGGGASTLVDHLLTAGYTNVTVLDIARKAIEQAKARLGDLANKVTWHEGDITTYTPERQYDIWHDRAVFHFLVDGEDRARYLATLDSALKPDGHAIIATFSENGPSQCDGLEVVRYSPETLSRELAPLLRLVETLVEEHQTPAGGVQQFVYCRFCRSNFNNPPVT